MLLRLGGTLAAALALAGAAQAAAPAAPSRVAAAADAVVAAGVPGVSVYARSGSRTAVVVRGYADLATRRPLTAADRFRIGSVTKSFVATVVLQLVRERKLALDDSIAQYLPGLVPNGSAITLRQLLSHTSGLADYFSNKRILAPYAHSHTYDWPHEQLVRISTADRPVFAPGAPGRAAYSNTGVFLLGLAIEHVTHRPLGDELARRIFRPLGLVHTSLASKARPAGPLAHGYSTYFGKWADVSVFSPSVLWAAGGILSTPTEVATFYRALFQGRLLPLRLVHEMQSPQVAIGREQIGLGLFGTRFRCGHVWGHGGNFPGYSTSAYGSADGRHQVVVAVDVDEEVTQTQAMKEAVGRLMDVAYCG
jgi:D-alanyl-D-alanine carboxypeptidase